MQVSRIHRLVSWLVQPFIRDQTGQFNAPAATDGSSAIPFEPCWHGDHWQNLLSSPMDARRYVMEDWSLPTTSDWRSIDGIAPAH